VIKIINNIILYILLIKNNLILKWNNNNKIIKIINIYIVQQDCANKIVRILIKMYTC